MHIKVPIKHLIYLNTLLILFAVHTLQTLPGQRLERGITPSRDHIRVFPFLTTREDFFVGAVKGQAEDVGEVLPLQLHRLGAAVDGFLHVPQKHPAVISSYREKWTITTTTTKVQKQSSVTGCRLITPFIYRFIAQLSVSFRKETLPDFSPFRFSSHFPHLSASPAHLPLAAQESAAFS